MRDREYERKRNALISAAERFADETIGFRIKGEEKIAQWNRLFHNKMNELWKERKEKDAD